MKLTARYIATAAIALVAVPLAFAQQQQQQPQQRSRLLPAGAQVDRDVSAAGIRETLAEATEAAVTVGGFNDLVERFVDADRNRIGGDDYYNGYGLDVYDDYDDSGDAVLDKLNGRIQQIQKVWENKYGGDFAMDEARVFGNRFAGLRIVPGEINDPVRFARNWPVDSTPGKPGGIRRDAEFASHRDDVSGFDDDDTDGIYQNDEFGVESPYSYTDIAEDNRFGYDEGIYDLDYDYDGPYDYDNYVYDDSGFDWDIGYDDEYDGFDYDTKDGYYFDGAAGYEPYDDDDYVGDAPVRNIGDKNLERGREVAVVHLPARGNLPALRASMIEEAFGWKIDVPETVGRDQLQRLLLNHLTYLGENPQVWPQDEAEAYRLFGHHILMASYGLGVPAYQQQQQSQQQPSQR